METDFEAVQTFSTRLKSIWRQLSKFRFLEQPWAEDVIRVKQSSAVHPRDPLVMSCGFGLNRETLDYLQYCLFI